MWIEKIEISKIFVFRPRQWRGDIDIEKGVQSKISMLNDKLNKNCYNWYSTRRGKSKERVGRDDHVLTDPPKSPTPNLTVKAQKPALFSPSSRFLQPILSHPSRYHVLDSFLEERLFSGYSQCRWFQHRLAP